MNLQFVERAVLKSGKFLKRNLPYILAGLGSVGVVATTVSAVKATEKVNSICFDENDPKQQSKEFIKAYTPTFVFGLATIGCIVGSAALSKKAYTSLSSAYILLEQKYKRYQEKNIEINGEEAHKKVLEAIADEWAVDMFFTAPGLIDCSSTDFDDANEEKVLFYDIFSDRKFVSTFSKVLNAEYHTNRNLVLGAEIGLNDFYDYLGLGNTPCGDDIGWAQCEWCQWIDFKHKLVTLDGGVKCWVIDTVQPPIPWKDYFDQ